ncbi:MAG: adenosylcobinamide-GDP ribazoletransferase [Lysobacteraceae bacterium]
MNPLRALAHELRLLCVALQYFTRLPVPTLHRFDTAWLSASVRYFPIAGLVVGGIGALTLWAAAQILPIPLAAALALTATIATTGAFHEDGLADTFDALGGVVSRERALEIMRDSRIGTYGATALVLGLLLRWQALSGLPLDAAWLALPCAHAAARAGAAALMAGLPYVRLEDDAKAKPVAQSLTPRVLVAALVAGALPSLGVALLVPHLALPLLAGAGAVVLAHAGCRRWYARRLGGYTGDGLGCCEQLGEIAHLLAVLAVLRLA